MTRRSVTLRPTKRAARVESFALANAVGIPMVPANVNKLNCPKAHRPACIVQNGKSCHLEMCAASITHSRHDATKKQLCYELTSVLRGEASAAVTLETGIGEDGRIEKRKRGSDQRGQKLIGDVYVRAPSRSCNHLFLDVGWKSLMGMSQLRDKRSVAQMVFDEKRAHFATLGIRNSEYEYLPVAISTSGAVWGGSVSALSKFNLPDAAWRRIVAEGLMAQAEAAVAIIEELEKSPGAQPRGPPPAAAGAAAAAVPAYVSSDDDDAPQHPPPSASGDDASDQDDA